jgi:hypothetical protein
LRIERPAPLRGDIDFRDRNGLPLHHGDASISRSPHERQRYAGTWNVIPGCRFAHPGY